VTAKVRLGVNHSGRPKKDRIVKIADKPKHPAKPKVKPRGRGR
jgi:hypothetical protein